MRRWVVGGLLLPLVLGSGCWLASATAHAQALPTPQAPAAAVDGPAPPLASGVRSITLSQANLNQALRERFPLSRNLQGLLQIELSQPEVLLRPELNRLQTRLQLQVSEPFTGSRHSGSVQLQHRLRFEASDRSLRLSDIMVTELDFPNVPEPYRSLLRAHAPTLVAQALPELPLYTAQAKDTALLDGLGFAIGRIDVTAKGLRVALLPPTALPSAGESGGVGR